MRTIDKEKIEVENFISFIKTMQIYKVWTFSQLEFWLVSLEERTMIRKDVLRNNVTTVKILKINFHVRFDQHLIPHR